MLPPSPNRRRPGAVAVLTLFAVILQIVAYLAVFNAAMHEARTLDEREAALQRVVTHIDTEVSALEATQAKGK
jgi:hypothetical protein